MRYIKVVAAVSVSALLIACAGGGTAPSESAGGVLAAKGGASGIPGASASGEGQAQLPTGFGILDFSFGVTQHTGGHVTGSFHQYRARNGLIVDFSGDATCVSVDPVNHRAWIGGVVTANNSTDPAFRTAIHEVGDDVWFRVVDNGEGNAAAPDRSTVLGFQGAGGIITSLQYCTTMPWAAGDANTYPLIEGNIQVRAH